jgi:predicted Fe-S protein YdhL (DUF1289 family)
MKSPCKKKCAVVSGHCSGCGRSLYQIKNWTQFSDEERNQIMEQLDNQANTDDLLRKVVDWYDEKFMTGTLKDIIEEIRVHLNGNKSAANDDK